MTRAFLGVGSNLGDRSAHLSRARELVSRTKGIRFLRSSAVHETDPVGEAGPPQGKFLNAVWEIDCDLSAEDLFARLLGIEKELGRVRSVRFAPRTLDLDLLFYGECVSESPELTLPHPRLHERLFVLEPLAELAPGWVHPVKRKSIRALLEAMYETHPQP